MGFGNTKPGTCWITGKQGPTEPVFTLIGRRNVATRTLKAQPAKCGLCGGKGRIPTTDMVKQKDGSYRQIKGWTSCPNC